MSKGKSVNREHEIILLTAKWKNAMNVNNMKTNMYLLV